MSFLAILAATASIALADPQQEARVRALEQEIRCVVCQNEPIAQSTAEIAGDMRDLVRDRVAAGDSDAEIRDFFRARYGDFVLFRPPFDARTWALWGAPGALLLVGLLWVFGLRRGRDGTADAFTPEEGER
jgi:cytochrome c-type biogenesis protein CcmH